MEKKTIYKAETGAKVVINNKEYSGDMAIEGLNEKQIENLLKRKMIRKIEFTEGGKPQDAKPPKGLSEMSRDELLAKAAELKIVDAASLSDKDLRKRISETKA